MNILITKLLSILIYPMGLIAAFIIFALLLRLFGRRKKSKFFVAIALILLFVASSPRTANYLATQLEQQYPPIAIADLPQTRTLVMLGGVLAPPKNPRLVTELVGSSDRLFHASRIYKQGKIEKIYLAGGNVFTGYLEHGESFYAKELLVEWGVPLNDIEIGESSRTTYQNAIEARDYLTEKGLIDEPVILVTSALHMSRSVESFRAVGINVIPASTDILITDATSPSILGWLPSAGALGLTTVAWHEMVGLWYYRLRGWAKESG